MEIKHLRLQFEKAIVPTFRHMQKPPKASPRNFNKCLSLDSKIYLCISMQLKSDNMNYNSCTGLDRVMLATVTNKLQNHRSLSQRKCILVYFSFMQ